MATSTLERQVKDTSQARRGPWGVVGRRSRALVSQAAYMDVSLPLQAQGYTGMRNPVLHSDEESRLWGLISYRVAVPVLLGAALGLTVLLVITLEDWYAALSEAISLGAHPEEIPRSDLIKVAVMVLLLGATALVSVYILESYRRTQHQLARAQELSRNILEHVVTGVVALDRQGNISMANPSATRILDLPSDLDGLDLDWLEAHHPDLGAVLRAVVEEDRHVQDRDISSTTPDGTAIWLRVTTTPMPLADRPRSGLIALVKDVTSLVSMEKQLRRLDRLAVTESLAAGVAHEIRNPLTAIDLNLRLLRGEVTSESPNWEEIHSHFEILTEETRRLNRITEQFLNFSRRSPAPHQALSVSGVVERVLRLIATEADEKGIRIQTSIAADLEDVLGDAEHLEQAFLNIIVNAMEAMPEGGEISVSVSGSGPPEERRIEVLIADQGPGVSEKDLARLFDPYFTTKQYGTGLGLAIAHRIVTDHDGEIALENAPGGGAVARVRLPVTAAAGESISDETHERQTSAR